MTFALAIIVAVLAMIQKSTGRRYVALVYASVHFAHFSMSEFLVSDYWYFISAAMADVLIMVLVMRFGEINDTAIWIFRVCIAEIVVNAIGWGMWYHYLEPTFYVMMFQLLQVWLIVILLRKDRADELGGYKVAFWRDIFRLVFGQSDTHIQSSNN